MTLKHDNAHPRTATTTKMAIHELGREVIPHPLYPPDLTPSDFHLLRSLCNKIRNFLFKVDLLMLHQKDQTGLVNINRIVCLERPQHGDSRRVTRPRCSTDSSILKDQLKLSAMQKIAITIQFGKRS